MPQKSNQLTPEFIDLWTDFRIPKTAIELRSVNTASVTTFSSSLTPGVAYVLASDGATAYVTFNGVDPTRQPGTGSNQAIPIMNGEKFPFVVPDTTYQIRAVCSGTSATVLTNLTLYRAVVSQSIASGLATTQGISE